MMMKTENVWRSGGNCWPAEDSDMGRRGFSLLQLVLVMAILALLSSLMLGVVGRGQAAANRAECDAHLKEISMALDTFRQETGRYPASLTELVDKHYLPAASMYCPADPDRRDPADHGYADFYLIREPRDSEELPVVVCPYHEADGSRGAQAYKGRYTQQNVTQPASLITAIGTTVKRPGQAIVSGTNKMLLHGGDRIVTGTAGSAVVRFADASTATLGPSCDLTLMQSFADGTTETPLYTLVRQNVPATIGGAADANVVTYEVTTGSGFDVSTPTATAGALGTRFQLLVKGVIDTDTTLTVLESTVALTNTSETQQFYVSPTVANSNSTADDEDDDVSATPITVNLGDKTRKTRRRPRRRGHHHHHLLGF